MKINKPVWIFALGSWRIGLQFDTIHTLNSRSYAVGIYVPMLTCVLSFSPK